MKQLRSNSTTRWRAGLIAVVIAVIAALVPTTAAHAATAPGQPLNLHGSLYVGGIVLVWDAPLSDGGSPILDYVVEEATSSDGPWNVIVDGVAPVTNTGFGYRVPGQTYWYRVKAVNAIGTGPASTTMSIVFGTIPQAPTGLTAVVLDDRAITLSWNAEMTGLGDPITDFVVERATGAAGPWTVVTDGVSTNKYTTVSGLTAGVTYWFRVKAVNSTATGQPSNVASATAISPPLQVLSLAALALDAHSVQLSWDEDEALGTRPVVDRAVYVATDAAGPYQATSISYSVPTIVTVGSLTTGTTYYFKVRPVNNAGWGPWSDSVSATPGLQPQAPTQVRVVPGNTSLTISWQPPVDDGGSPITGYQVSFALAGTATWTDLPEGPAARSARIDGLLNGTAYDVRVVAENQLGPSPAVTLTATPRGLASAPLSLKGVAKSKSVALSWLLPSVTGGANLTNYVVQKATAKRGPWRTVTHPASTARRLTVKNLKAKKRYYFRVAAVNAAGRGAWSAVISVVPKR